VNVDDTTDGPETATASERPESAKTAQSEKSSLQRWGRRLGFGLWIAVVVLAVGPRLLSASTDVGPATLSLRLSPSVHGGLAVGIPPSGEVSAQTHKGPVEVGLTFEAFETLSQPTGNLRPDALLDGAVLKEGMTRLVLKYALFAGLGSILIGVVAAAILPKRSKKTLIAGGAVGFATTLLLAACVVPGFDGKKFKEATDQGSNLSSTAMLNSIVGLSSIDKRAELLSDRLLSLYLDTVSGEKEEVADNVILHVSDLHLNPIGVRLARRLATEIDATAIIDTGDMTSFGTPPDQSFADLFSKMGVPYYYVAGNHDSPEFRDQIKNTPGVFPLDGHSYQVGELTIAGVDDPTYSELQKDDRASWTAQYKENDAKTLASIESAHPDLLALHNPVMAKAALGKVATILSGHTHKFSLGKRKNTVLAVVGSSGATGLGSLVSKKTIPYAFEILRYKGKKLLAVDRVEFGGLDGKFSVTRVLSGSTTAKIPNKLLDSSVPEKVAPDVLATPEDLEKALAEWEASTTTTAP
jgi:predicted phosphodiesterase